MSLTFNSNNNYSVEIITEADLSNPSTIEYSATTNTPFVTMKIIPTNPQTQPVLASNIKIDDIIPDFSWNENVNYNVKGICEPPATPHGANSSIQHVTGIGVVNACQAFGHTSFFGSSSLPQQGPYSAQNDPVTQTSQIAANGISWSEIVLIEVYEDDLGQLINDSHSPFVAENYNEWLMWSGPIQTPGGPRREITTNIYPIYVKAFVYLNFGSGGITSLTSNTTLELDIDEVELTFGCTDSNSTSYDSLATIDDGSCTYPPVSGCTDPNATNYDPLATVDDGSCILPIYGCTDPNATNYYAGATIDDGSCTYPPTFTLPPFTFTHAVDYSFIDLNYPTPPADPVFMATLSLDIQAATNTWYGSTGVIYEITELYYIDDTGAQVDLQHTTNPISLNPPFGLTSIPPFNLTHYFANPLGSNIVTGVTLGPLPIDVTLSVPPSILASPVSLPAIIFPRYGTNPFYSTSIDVYCTVTAYDQPGGNQSAFVSSHTEMLNITL